MRGRVASLLEVGTGFHSELTGRENIYFNGSVLGMRKAEIKRKFDEIVAFSEVETFLDTPVKRYSSGMYVRLAFAVAAHLEPDILIIDEVLAVGDAAFQRKCLDRIGDISSREGRTILFVSHNMASIQSLCEKAFLLDNGKLIQEGTAKDVVNNYLRSAASMECESLDKRNDRSGDGSIRFTSINIEGMNQEKTIYTGSRVKITLGYRSQGPIFDPFFCIEVYSSASNSCLFRLATESKNGFPDSLPSEGYVTCETDPITIPPSRCYVHLTGGSRLIDGDYIMRAAYFDVEEERFYGTEDMKSIGNNFTMINSKWIV
jgi:lipopolysaccharide transport system ATP-binding protein